MLLMVDLLFPSAPEKLLAMCERLGKNYPAAMHNLYQGKREGLTNSGVKSIA
jgi:hypothetical protein